MIAIFLAIIFALIFAIVVDLLRIGSRTRDFVRSVKNKIAERSVARLQKRIKELEQYRDTLNLMMSSDKALYLGTFRAIFGTLVFMCIGATIFILRHSEMLAVAQPQSPGALGLLDMGAIAMFAIAMTVALYCSATMVAEDNKSKVAAQIEKYNAEIENLKMILNSRLQKLGPRA